MKKIEANTLEEAYAEAARAFDCSLTDLKCEIIQHPSSGVLGLFKKPAIIVAIVETAKSDRSSVPVVKVQKKKQPKDKPAEKCTQSDPKPKETQEIARTKEPSNDDKISCSEQTVLESFFDHDSSADKVASEGSVAATTNNIALQESIEKQLISLMKQSCFDMDVIEVDVVETTAYIFMDGEDAALLIGKEGYRYNALSYLISNWLYSQHNLYMKLEIAQFLASQQEMIRNYIQSVIDHVEGTGWGRTRALDGVLVQIALEQLREEFPNKYVAIKRMRDGGRYVLINEFKKNKKL